MDQPSRIAWYKQQVHLAAQGKLSNDLDPQFQLRELLEMARLKEIFPAHAVADIGRLVFIALGELAEDEDSLFDLWEEAKGILAGPDLGSVESAYTKRRLVLATGEV